MNRPDTHRFNIEPLGREHDRSGFSCGVEALDRYLKSQAMQDARRNVTAPFVLIEKASGAIAGYYTLSMTSIDTGWLPDAVARKLPRYPRMPAVLIGRLAVDQKFRGSGLGSFLLMDALAQSMRNDIAWVVALVDAKDESACAFYEHFGFTRFADRASTLFIHRQKIEAAFGPK